MRIRQDYYNEFSQETKNTLKFLISKRGWVNSKHIPQRSITTLLIHGYIKRQAVWVMWSGLLPSDD